MTIRSPVIIGYLYNTFYKAITYNNIYNLNRELISNKNLDVINL